MFRRNYEMNYWSKLKGWLLLVDFGLTWLGFWTFVAEQLRVLFMPINKLLTLTPSRRIIVLIFNFGKGKYQHIWSRNTSIRWILPMCGFVRRLYSILQNYLKSNVFIQYRLNKQMGACVKWENKIYNNESNFPGESRQ